MAITLDEEDLKFLKEAGFTFFMNDGEYRNVPIRRESSMSPEFWVYADSNFVVFDGPAICEAPFFDYARKKYPEEFI